MKNILTEIQNRVYELEGLLHLAITRDECPEGIMRLVKDKIGLIGELGKGLGSRQADAQSEGLEMPADTDTGFAEYASIETAEEESADEAIEDVATYDALSQAETCDQPETPVQPEAPVPADAAVRQVTPASKEKRRKPFFCINDRFRFTRSLYGGNVKEFDSDVDRIIQFSGYAEAERYFLAEKGWDPESEDVTDFLELLKIYFG